MVKNLVGVQRTAAYTPDAFEANSTPSSLMPDMPDWIRIERVDSQLHIGVAGDIDMASAPQFRAALLQTLASPTRPTGVQVDLSLVDFIDARGVAALAEGCDVASRSGVAFAVNNPQRRVRQMLDIVGLTEVLRVRPAGEQTAAIVDDGQ
jgi:anti-sigma B factor antagonist